MMGENVDNTKNGAKVIHIIHQNSMWNVGFHNKLKKQVFWLIIMKLQNSTKK